MRKMALVLILCIAVTGFAKYTDRYSNYLAWFNDFKATINNYTYYGNSSYKEDLEELLWLKPSGGGSYYMEWLNFQKSLMGDYTYYGNSKYMECCQFMDRAFPENTPVGYWGEWLKVLCGIMDNYTYYGNSKYKECVEVLKSQYPRSGAADYQTWYNTYKKYKEEHEYYGGEKRKYCVDVIISLKPDDNGGSYGGELPEFLKDPDKTVREVISSEKAVHEFNTLFSLYKEALKNEAVNGQPWAKREWDRLKSIMVD